MGDTTGAKRVLVCGAEAYGRRTCKRRDCPTCAAARAKANAGKLAAMVARMSSPLVVLVTLTSAGAFDLGPTMRAFRDRLARLRRRRCVARYVIAGAGAIEPHLARSGERWEVHAHVAIVVVPGFDLRTVARAWRTLTRKRGRFMAEPDPRLRSAAGFAAYVTKPNDWCPPPGTLDRKRLEILFRATKGRRVLVAWGAALPKVSP